MKPTVKIVMSFACFLLLPVFSAPLFGQFFERPQQDVTANTFHVFPQIADGAQADGSYYRTYLVVTNEWAGANQCVYRLYGVEATRLNASAGMSLGLAGDRLTFGFLEVESDSVARLRPLAFVSSKGTGTLQTGFATLTCTERVTAMVTYGLFNTNDDPESLATVFSSQNGVYQQFLITGEFDLAFAVANHVPDRDLEYPMECKVNIFEQVSINAPLIPFPCTDFLLCNPAVGPIAYFDIDGNTNLARYLWEIMTNSNNYVGTDPRNLIPDDFLGTARLRCHNDIPGPTPNAYGAWVIGLLFDEQRFTTLPRTVTSIDLLWDSFGVPIP